MIGYHFLRHNYRAGRGDEKPWVIGETRIIPVANRKKIVLCKYGYHFSPTLFDALMYAPGPLACLVQVPDESQVSKEDSPKGVTYQRTLVKAINVDRELRLFAADCAERVLLIFERERPNDDRPRKAIQAARDFANGKIDAAARAAARAAETKWQRAHFSQMFAELFEEQSR